jgi:hypothetical protein
MAKLELIQAGIDSGWSLDDNNEKYYDITLNLHFISQGDFSQFLNEDGSVNDLYVIDRLHKFFKKNKEITL